MKYDFSSITAWAVVDGSAGIRIMSFLQGFFCWVSGLLRSPLWQIFNWDTSAPLHLNTLTINLVNSRFGAFFCQLPDRDHCNTWSNADSEKKTMHCVIMKQSILDEYALLIWVRRRCLNILDPGVPDKAYGILHSGCSLQCRPTANWSCFNIVAVTIMCSWRCTQCVVAWTDVQWWWPNQSHSHDLDSYWPSENQLWYLVIDFALIIDQMVFRRSYHYHGQWSRGRSESVCSGLRTMKDGEIWSWITGWTNE